MESLTSINLIENVSSLIDINQDVFWIEVYPLSTDSLKILIDVNQGVLMFSNNVNTGSIHVD